MHLHVRRHGVVALAALALALPAAPAVAAPSGDAATATRASAAADAPPAITSLSFKTAATHSKRIRGTFVRGTVKYTGAVDGVTSEVRVNGVLKGTVELAPNGFYYNPKWGAGKVVVGPSTIHTSSGDVASTTKSKAFRVRYGLRASGTLGIKRKGTRLAVSAKNIQYFQKTKYVSAGKIAFQTKKKSGWVTLKTIKLNSKGNGSYALRYSKKRSYRLHISTTTSRQGGNTRTVKI